MSNNNKANINDLNKIILNLASNSWKMDETGSKQIYLFISVLPGEQKNDVKRILTCYKPV